jgi:hypothetical protein
MHQPKNPLAHRVTSAERNVRRTRETYIHQDADLYARLESFHHDISPENAERIMSSAMRICHVGGANVRANDAIQTIEEDVRKHGDGFSRKNSAAARALATSFFEAARSKMAYEEARIELGQAIMDENETPFLGTPKTRHESDAQKDIFYRVIIEEEDRLLKTRMDTWSESTRSGFVSLGHAFFSWWFGIHKNERPALTAALLVSQRGPNPAPLFAKMFAGMMLNENPPLSLLALQKKYPEENTATKAPESQLVPATRSHSPITARLISKSTQDIMYASSAAPVSSTPPPSPAVGDIQRIRSDKKTKLPKLNEPTRTLSPVQDVISKKPAASSSLSGRYVTLFAKAMGMNHKSQQEMLANLPVSTILSLIPPQEHADAYIQKGAVALFEHSHTVSWQKLNMGHVLAAEAIRASAPNALSHSLSLGDFLSRFGEKTYATYAKMKGECIASPVRIS